MLGERAKLIELLAVDLADAFEFVVRWQPEPYARNVPVLGAERLEAKRAATHVEVQHLRARIDGDRPRRIDRAGKLLATWSASRRAPTWSTTFVLLSCARASRMPVSNDGQ